MNEFRFYGVEVDQKYLLSETICNRMKHTPGFVGVNIGETTATVIFEDHFYAEDFFAWKRANVIPIIRAGLIYVPVKDIPKSRRRKYKKYIVREGRS